MKIRTHALLTLAALTVVLLPGCGSKSNDETPAPAKDGAMKNREGGDAGTPGASATPNSTGAAPVGSNANPQGPEGK